MQKSAASMLSVSSELLLPQQSDAQASSDVIPRALKETTEYENNVFALNSDYLSTDV